MTMTITKQYYCMECGEAVALRPGIGWFHTSDGTTVRTKKVIRNGREITVDDHIACPKMS
jgi:DNA-directed RNA polymerase subunit RPC12/RpoP